MRKTCFKCGASKARSEFYKHPKMADGLLGKCKSCTKSDVAARRDAKHADVCAYDRQRSREPGRRARVVGYQRAARARSPERRAAHQAVHRALKAGKLTRGPCLHCGDPRVQAHHRDYSRPLDVVWVCFACHRSVEHGHRVDQVGAAPHSIA